MTKGCTHERDKDLAMKMLEQSNFSVVSMNLANLLGSTGRYQESLDRDLAGLAALNKLDARTDSLLFRAQSYTASLCEKLRRPADAERYYQRALTTARRLFGPDEWWRMHLKCRPALWRALSSPTAPIPFHCDPLRFQFSPLPYNGRHPSCRRCTRNTITASCLSPPS
jgi:hypothetical protein